MKQPEEMPSIKCPHENAEHGRCQNCGIEVIITPYDEQPRADLAAKPDNVDVEKLKREAVRWCLANAANMDLEELGNAFIDHLYSRNLIPPVEPVRRDDARCALCGAKDDLRAGVCYTCANPDKTCALQVLSCVTECFNDDEAEYKQCKILENYINRCALTQSPAPDLDKIAEKIEGMRKPPLGASVPSDQLYRTAFNVAIDAAIELIKQARG